MGHNSFFLLVLREAVLVIDSVIKIREGSDGKAVPGCWIAVSPPHRLYCYPAIDNSSLLGINMDAPIKQILKIGKATVGLIGIDVALNRVIKDRALDVDQAAEQVYREIKKKNYIPAGAVADYQKAIRNEILLLRGEKARANDELVIRVLGHGCVSCNNLQKIVIEVVSTMGVAADVFQVHDPDEIGRFGVVNSPALVINCDLKCEGRLPSRSQVESWIREYLL